MSIENKKVRNDLTFGYFKAEILYFYKRVAVAQVRKYVTNLACCESLLADHCAA